MTIGPLVVGKKAAQYGYRAYGLPGAVVAGAVGVIGVLAAQRGVDALVTGEAAEREEEPDGTKILIEPGE